MVVAATERQARQWAACADPALPDPCKGCAVRSRTMCAVLDATEQAHVASIMTNAEVAPHTTIFHEADPAEYVYNVTEGALKLYKMLPDGRQQVTGFIFPGDFLGLAYNDRYACSAETLKPTTLCRFPRKRLEALFRELPQLERRLLGLASNELAAAQDQMLLLGRKTARERVASFLLMLSAGAQRRGMPADPILLPMTRGEIADYLGLTLETVSRNFSWMKTRGLIRLLEGGALRILDPAALAKLADGD